MATPKTTPSAPPVESPAGGANSPAKPSGGVGTTSSFYRRPLTPAEVGAQRKKEMRDHEAQLRLLWQEQGYAICECDRAPILEGAPCSHCGKDH